MKKKRLLIRDFIPPKALPLIKDIFYNLRYFFYKGNKLFCPCCERSFRKFLDYAGSQNDMCPGCAALSRHRLLWLYLKNETNLFTDKLDVLHFAPEYIFQKNLSKLKKINYVTADLSHPSARYHFDITNIPFKDNSFDVIICNHVLQEVPDDKKAMQEIYRVLKKKGWALLQVPINENLKKTFEDFTTKDRKKRSKLLGYPEALRIYGQDYKGKLSLSGFKVRIIDYLSRLNEKLIKKYGLFSNEKIYLCKKT